MSIESIFIILALVAAVALWMHHSKINLRATAHASQYCAQQGVQLLDQTVILTKLSPRLRLRHVPCLRRTFRFEFATKGDRRYLGWVTLDGWRLNSVYLQPFSEHTLL